MGLSDSLLQVKDRVSGAVSNFFYPRDEYPRDDRTVTRRERREASRRERVSSHTDEYDGYAEQGENPVQEGGWTGPQVHGSSPYQNTNPYQTPDPSRLAQNTYQQPQSAYQFQGQAAQQTQGYASQGAFQQPRQVPQDQSAPQGQDANILFFPNAQQQAREMSARVITARSVSDCYSAITQLRLGDMVILVMDSITDPAEMRHYVDMLSGACYSLRATITKLSRHGAYLICPAQIRVYVDAATNQLNSGARQTQRPLQGSYSPRYTPGMNPAPYGAETARSSAGFDTAFQNPAPDGAFTQAGGKDYFGRSAMPDARGTADHLQPYANGYMPDSPMDQTRAL